MERKQSKHQSNVLRQNIWLEFPQSCVLAQRRLNDVIVALLGGPLGAPVWGSLTGDMVAASKTRAAWRQDPCGCDVMGRDRDVGDPDVVFLYGGFPLQVGGSV